MSALQAVSVGMLGVRRAPHSGHFHRGRQRVMLRDFRLRLFALLVHVSLDYLGYGSRRQIPVLPALHEAADDDLGIAPRLDAFEAYLDAQIGTTAEAAKA